MNKQEEQIMNALKPLRAKGLIVTDIIPTPPTEFPPTKFEIMFHRIITDTTHSQIEIKKQQAEAKGFTARFLVGWGRVMYQNGRGDKTLVCPKCGERYDWLATMLNLSNECESLQQDLKCRCNSELKLEMVFTSAIIRYSVTVKISPILHGELEHMDKTELARQLRKALEAVIDKLNFGEKTSSQRDVAEELKHCKKDEDVVIIYDDKNK